MIVQDDKNLQETPSQTAGPYLHIGLVPWAFGLSVFKTHLGAEIAGPLTLGKRIIVSGRIIDGAGNLVRDALLEVWQANSKGIYRHPEDPRFVQLEEDFHGWGRAWTDFDSGEWSFQTVKPGLFRDREGDIHAPHINMWIVARGINIGLNTRIYFADEMDINKRDPVLNMILPKQRRRSLLAKYKDEKSQVEEYFIDIVLQGEHETVFLNI